MYDFYIPFTFLLLRDTTVDFLLYLCNRKKKK